MAVAQKTGTKIENPGKWKHGGLPLLFNFEPREAIGQMASVEETFGRASAQHADCSDMSSRHPATQRRVRFVSLKGAKLISLQRCPPSFLSICFCFFKGGFLLFEHPCFLQMPYRSLHSSMSSLQI